MSESSRMPELLQSLQDQLRTSSRDNTSEGSAFDAETRHKQVSPFQLPERGALLKPAGDDKTPTANRYRENGQTSTQQPVTDIATLADYLSRVNAWVQQRLEEAHFTQNPRSEQKKMLAQVEEAKIAKKHERLNKCRGAFAQRFVKRCYQETILDRKAIRCEPSYRQYVTRDFRAHSFANREQARKLSKELMHQLGKHFWLWLSGDDEFQGRDLEEEANETMVKLQKAACLQTSKSEQFVNSDFLYNNVPDAIREIRISVHLSNAELNLREARSPKAKNKEQTLENARREAMNALEAARAFDYDPLSARCQYWLGLIAHDRSESNSDNVAADKLEAAEAFLSASRTIGHYWEGEQLKHFVKQYTSEMQKIARSKDKLSEEGIMNFLDKVNAAPIEDIAFDDSWRGSSAVNSLQGRLNSGVQTGNSLKNQIPDANSSSPSASSAPTETHFHIRSESKTLSESRQHEQEDVRKMRMEQDNSPENTQESLANAQKGTLKKSKVSSLRIKTNVAQESSLRSHKDVYIVQNEDGLQGRERPHLEPGRITTESDTMDEKGVYVYRTRPPGDASFQRKSPLQSPRKRRSSVFSGSLGPPQPIGPLRQQQVKAEEERHSNALAAATSADMPTRTEPETAGTPEQGKSKEDSGSDPDSPATAVLHSPPGRRDSKDDHSSFA